MNKKLYFLVTSITFYRLTAAFMLALLLVLNRLELFKWLLPVSFLTDALDGYLARKYKVVSPLGAKLDSVADQLTLVAAIAGLFVFRSDFLKENMVLFIFILALYAFQTVLALRRYHRISSFHTYLAKAANILTGIFLVLLFLLPEPIYPLFYLTAAVISLELLEEIVLVLLLPEWETDVKGLFWVLKRKGDI